ncbi:MAG: Fic family protein [Candidatus Omnitrophica bacterium]|nr:Fic family protein [Candidatus Omnitrophota bacterium]
MNRAGTYINQLQGDIQYKAFVPNPLPYEVKVDETLQHLLSKADLALGRLDGITEILPDVDFFIFMYTRKEATLSSQVEGTQATFADVLKAEAKIEDGEIHKDVDEILNYIKALGYGLKKLEQLPFSLRLIKEIHATLLKGVRGEARTPGEFRKTQNWVGGATINTARFVPPPSHELMRLLDNLEKFLHEHTRAPILIKTGLIHSQFETIHPFLDGNGRVGRLLITFYLCQQRVLRRPLLYISEFFKMHRQEYYDRLNAVRTEDGIEDWLKFFIEGVAITADKAVDTTRKILKLRERDIHKVMILNRASIRGKILLDFLYKAPLVQIKTVERVTGLKNPNAIALVSKFVKLGILKEITGHKRNRVFSYRDYIELFE